MDERNDYINPTDRLPDLTRFLSCLSECVLSAGHWDVAICFKGPFLQRLAAQGPGERCSEQGFTYLLVIQ